MTDAPAPTVPSPAPAEPAKPAKPGFRFTLPGCRTELRLGAFLVLAGTFLWNFVGPTWAMRLVVAGAPLLLIGAVTQALAARRGVDAMPWRLALCMLILGGAMCWDFRFRDLPGGPLQVVLVGPALAGAGLWILLWSLPNALWLRAHARAEAA